MDLIDQIHIPRGQGGRRPAVIQLLAGDLSAIPSAHEVDVLVVSAFPNSYTPNSGTLFASLKQRGLDVEEVAARKDIDERKRLGCWLSEPLEPELVRRFHFSRILCFEPSHPEFLENSGVQVDQIEEQVGFVFRCLNSFVIPDLEGRRNLAISRVAMPLLATGNQAVPLESLLPRLLEAACFWLEHGLPIDELKIVAFRSADLAVAHRIFGQARQRRTSRVPVITVAAEASPVPADWKAELATTLAQSVIETCRHNLRRELMAVASANERTVLEHLFEQIPLTDPLLPAPRPIADYDLFLSYAHKDETAVKEFVAALHHRAPGLKIFYDRTSIPPGGHWIRLISDAVQHARIFVAILSPAYSASPVCWDEFQCAKLKEYTTRQAVIKTIRLYQEKTLPPMMAIHSYIDCTEGDLTKLREAAGSFQTSS